MDRWVDLLQGIILGAVGFVMLYQRGRGIKKDKNEMPTEFGGYILCNAGMLLCLTLTLMCSIELIKILL